jgi:hypothetical protein
MRQACAILALSLLLATSAAASECDFGQMNPNAPPETTQFGFLIGNFTVTLHAWRDEAWTPPRPAGARWNGWWGLNGMAVYDEWYDPSPDDPDGTSGVNVRSFNAETGQWTMMWVALPFHQVQDLRAEVQDGVLTMWQVDPERPGWKADFEIIDADRRARVDYIQDPEGGAWTPRFRLEATRIPCNGGISAPN